MRRRLVLAVGAAALLVGLVLAVVLTAGGDQRGSTAADPRGTSAAPRATASSSGLPATDGPGIASTSSAAPSIGGPTATSAPAAPGSGPADQLPPDLPAVPLDSGATVPGVVTGRLVSVEAVQATGTGIGNVSGPALRVTVQLTGAGSGPVALDGSYVEVLTGPELAPASPVDDPSSAPLQGELAPGGTATGVYVFSVDEGARDDVTVRVQPAPGEPFLVFRGAAG